MESYIFGVILGNAAAGISSKFAAALQPEAEDSDDEADHLYTAEVEGDPNINLEEADLGLDVNLADNIFGSGSSTQNTPSRVKQILHPVKLKLGLPRIGSIGPPLLCPVTNGPSSPNVAARPITGVKPTSTSAEKSTTGKSTTVTGKSSTGKSTTATIGKSTPRRPPTIQKSNLELQRDVLILQTKLYSMQIEGMLQMTEKLQQCSQSRSLDLD